MAKRRNIVYKPLRPIIEFEQITTFAIYVVQIAQYKTLHTIASILPHCIMYTQCASLAILSTSPGTCYVPIDIWTHKYVHVVYM